MSFEVIGEMNGIKIYQLRRTDKMRQKLKVKRKKRLLTKSKTAICKTQNKRHKN